MIDSLLYYSFILVPPEWSSKPSDSVIAAVGDSLSVPCDAFGVPPPSRSWHKSGIHIIDSFCYT